ncbi:hypothetical protein [Cryobacterium sp. 5B3]|uniref:hypothetical protein n=1 Tax=Cryobacterium sp. 5B3 TaxID=3048586 RepID=UPI002AB40FE5|nr:hypothetical protein [Cryobacterium sp. 5B3]MDY7541791.1 hypothetical protein [Cryobacterium sp. 5B3]MEB0275229.1 hypothetical protein [Cryobacterium sp. 5B3]
MILFLFLSVLAVIGFGVLVFVGLLGWAVTGKPKTPATPKTRVFTAEGARSYNALRERRLREEISELEFVKAGYDIKWADLEYLMTRYEIFLRDLYTRQLNGELGSTEVSEAIATQTRLMAGGFPCDEYYVPKTAGGSVAAAGA